MVYAFSFTNIEKLHVVSPLAELYTPDQWEIDKDSVTLDKLIGQGHFGQVFQGILKLSDGTFKSCAVKVNPSETPLSLD